MREGGSERGSEGVREGEREDFHLYRAIGKSSCMLSLICFLLIMKLSETPETLLEVHSVSICSPSPTYSMHLGVEVVALSL